MIPQIVISCNVCFRIKPKAAYPLMENIPSYRVNIVLEPLIDTGVDFAEPSSITKSLYMFIGVFGYQSLTFSHIQFASVLCNESFLDCLKRPGSNFKLR